MILMPSYVSNNFYINGNLEILDLIKYIFFNGEYTAVFVGMVFGGLCVMQKKTKVFADFGICLIIGAAYLAIIFVLSTSLGIKEHASGMVEYD
jgi:hypothetical protein